MSVALTVDLDDPTPPYEQLRRQLSDLITAGQLCPGERLPALRQLAGDLGLAVGTVARAYRELEQEGRLVSRRGGGTRVATTRGPTAQDRHSLLTHMATDFVSRARSLGFDEREIVAALGHLLPLSRPR